MSQMCDFALEEQENKISSENSLKWEQTSDSVNMKHQSGYIHYFYNNNVSAS